VIALHNLARGIERYFGTQDEWAKTTRIDGDNLDQRRKRHLKRVLQHLMNAANDV
jgi:hypothetical protein